jgi:amino acid transporter
VTTTQTSTGGEGTERKKKIGLISALAFAVGAMIGGGVFTLSGTVINRAGPGALVSYALAGVIMLFSALSFVAIAARAKEGESGYGAVTVLLGRPWRFLVMWGFYLNALAAVAFLADSFGSYLHSYFLHDLSATAAGIVCIVLLVGLNLGPAVWVGRAETWVVAIKLGLLLVFIGWGLAAFSSTHFTPFDPHGATSILSTSALLFTAYTGFNVVTNIAPSLRDPDKTVPRAVIGAVLISVAMYMLVVLAMLQSGVTHFGLAGVSQAASVLMGHWGGQLVAFAACLSTLSGANAMLLGGSEIALRLVVDEDIPAFLGKTTKGGFPWMSVGLIGVIALMLVLFTSIIDVIVLCNIVALAAMVIVNMAAAVLAHRGYPGPGFRIPGGPLIPILAGAACVAQFFSYSLVDLAAAAAAMLVGFVLYAFRGYGRDLSTEEARDKLREAIRDLETPLGRALRHLERRS